MCHLLSEGQSSDEIHMDLCADRADVNRGTEIVGGRIIPWACSLLSFPCPSDYREFCVGAGKYVP